MDNQFKPANDFGNGQDPNQQPQYQQPQYQQQVPPQPQYQQPQYQQQVPPQPQYQQPQYQQQVPPQPQYQQPQYQQPMDNTSQKNNNKIIIGIICAVVAAALVVAGIFLGPKLFKSSSNNSASNNETNTAAVSTSSQKTSDTSNTPENAAQEACEERLKTLKNNSDKLKSAMMKQAPTNLSASDKQMSESIIDELVDIMIDSIDFQVKDVEVNGDTATASIKMTMIDTTELGSSMSKLTSYNSGYIKKLAKQCGTTSKTNDMKLHQENGKWVAEAKDVEEMLDLLNSI